MFNGQVMRHIGESAPWKRLNMVGWQLEVAGNSPVYSHGCKFIPPVADGAAGNSGLHDPWQKTRLQVFQVAANAYYRPPGRAHQSGLFLGLASAVWLHWNLFRFGSAVLRLRTLVAWNTY